MNKAKNKMSALFLFCLIFPFAAHSSSAEKALSTSPKKIIQKKTQTKGARKARPWLSVENACTKKEEWKINEAWAKYLKVPSEILELFEDQPSSVSQYQKRYMEVVELQKRFPSSDYRPFLQYWVWRSMLGLKLPAVARAGFGLLVSEDYQKNETLTPIVQAALGCSIEVKNIYSQFQWTESELKVLEEFPHRYFSGNDLEKLVKARADSLFSRILSSETAMLENSTPLKNVGRMGEIGKSYESFLQFTQLILTSEDSNQKIREGEKFLSSYSNHTAADWVYLTLGRLYYEKGEFAKSRSNFEKVKSKSMWFDEAMLGQSWAALLSKDYEKAVGMAYGLEASGYEKKFLPETTLIASMAYLEVCNYPSSFQAVDKLKSRYIPMNRWLEKFSQSDESAYQLITRYLQGKKGVPLQVLGSWVSSAGFEKGQKEINQLIDERNQFKKIADVILSEKKPELTRSWKIISDFALKEFPRFEKELVSTIDSSLKKQALAMLSRTSALLENTEFVEVEILNSASAGLVAKRRNSQAAEEDDSSSRKPAGGQMLGGFDTESEKGEVWNDEVGQFRAQLKNQCIKNKRNAKRAATE